MQTKEQDYMYTQRGDWHRAADVGEEKEGGAKHKEEKQKKKNRKQNRNKTRDNNTEEDRKWQKEYGVHVKNTTFYKHNIFKNILRNIHNIYNCTYLSLADLTNC